MTRGERAFLRVGPSGLSAATGKTETMCPPVPAGGASVARRRCARAAEPPYRRFGALLHRLIDPSTHRPIGSSAHRPGSGANRRAVACDPGGARRIAADRAVPPAPLSRG
ncbi:hypothetical protein DF122_23540 [Burkholderia pseudomallei]|nr:hypothetical protein BOC35_36325 [Burkholderia pseudomallei]ARK51791.1 hypothetical protein BOC36_00200 [Burkholderia pseudomallei]ARL22134.1 hypothetical protein BOC47_06720 [Burkholderia pseudomallei]ARL28446.1 hypothetical protein BOC48_02595 [Burkholderia pseudomallei]ARL72671.1 hypothetical protein BOC54_09940 [Burkholderia pseudomallei]